MFKGLIKRPIAVVMVLIAVMVLGIAAIISFIGRREFARRMTYVAEKLGRK